MPSRVFVGLMSGTSADGIDAVVTRVDGRAPHLRTTILGYASLPFDDAQRRRVLALPDAAPPELARMHVALGHGFADATLAALDAAGVAPSDVTAVSCAGLTVVHIPPTLDDPGATLALGDGDVIAERTGCDVLSDLRARDRAAGGHGAPLVPFADAVLLGNERPRAALNLGGIGNVTFTVPTRGAELPDVLAFDTGPANMVLDAALAARTDGELRFDRDGALGRAGRVDDAALDALLDGDDFFDRAPPKSTGRERYGAAFLARHAERLADLSLEDLAATLAAHAVHGVVRAVADHAPNAPEDVVVSGGGALNGCVMDGLARALAPARVTTSDEALGIPVALKECVAFALLAVASHDGVPSALPSVTGARRAAVLGKWSRRA